MRYIIPEKRLKDIVIKYLDSIDWRVLESTDEEHPLEVFEHNTDKGATFIVQCVTHRYGESCNVLIRSSFQERLERMFGKQTVSGGEDGEPNVLVMDWFNKHFNLEVEDYLYMDSQYMLHDED
jgi:hypothetical protein